MLKRIVVLLAVLLLPVVAVAGFYGFVWWKVDSAAKELAEQVSPFAEVQYGRVHVDLLAAEVGLADIAITPTLVPETIKISEVVLKASGWGDLLGLESALQRGEFPERLSLRQRGLQFSTQGQLARQLSTASAAQAPPVELPGAFCGEEQGVELARALGYRELVSDSSFSYYLDPVSSEMVVDLDGETRQMAAMSMQVKLQVQGGKLSAAAAMMGGVALKSFQVIYNDRGYNQRYRSYCQKAAGLDAEGFEQRLAEDFKAFLGMLGLVLTGEQREAIVAMYKPGAEVLVGINPAIPLGPAVQPQAHTPEAVMDLLNPVLEVNGRQVSLTEIRWQAPDLNARPRSHREPVVAKSAPEGAAVVEADAEQASESEVESPADVAATAPVSGSDDASGAVQAAPVAQVVPHQPGYEAVEVSQVGEFVGAKARMITYFGRRIEGRILEVSATDVLIEQRMDRGVANYSIARKKLAELEIYR